MRGVSTSPLERFGRLHRIGRNESIRPAVYGFTFRIPSPESQAENRSSWQCVCPASIKTRLRGASPAPGTNTPSLHILPIYIIKMQLSNKPSFVSLHHRANSTWVRQSRWTMVQRYISAGAPPCAYCFEVTTKSGHRWMMDGPTVLL
jgi:hypothetical protein